MGLVNHMQHKKFDKAISVLNRALIIQQEKLGKNDMDTAITLVIIAEVWDEQGTHEEEMENYQQVMPIYEKEYGNDSVQMSNLLFSIAAALHNQGKYKDAMVKYKCSLAIKEKLLRMKHVYTMNKHNNIEELKRM